MPDEYVCVGCSKRLSEVDTSSSLVSLKFGWRLTRRRDANGSSGSEWRCPECWQAHKARVAAAPPEPEVSTTDVTAVRAVPSSRPPEDKPRAAWSWVTPWRNSGRKR
jgi:hypothetical protein